MSSNDELLVPSSDSFWEIDCYKATVKRTEDGLHMCSELMKLITERTEIETMYSNKLKLWCKKWNNIIDKGTEYGTNKAILLGSLQEADAMGEVHNTIKDHLMEVHAELKKWKNDNYKKQMVIAGCKEAKQFEDEFRKAQKPWAMKLGKVQKAKKDYYNACKLEKAASNQATSQVGMANTTEDQVKKLQEKVEKCQRDVEQTRDKYEESLKDLESYKIIYMSDMTEVFERTQNFEEKRLGYFKDILIGVHSCLDLNKIPKIAEIYEQFRRTIELSDASQDLKWWSQNHGIDMPMNWPTFEERGEKIELTADGLQSERTFLGTELRREKEVSMSVQEKLLGTETEILKLKEMILSMEKVISCSTGDKEDLLQQNLSLQTELKKVTEQQNRLEMELKQSAELSEVVQLKDANCKQLEEEKNELTTKLKEAETEWELDQKALEESHEGFMSLGLRMEQLLDDLDEAYANLEKAREQLYEEEKLKVAETEWELGQKALKESREKFMSLGLRMEQVFDDLDEVYAYLEEAREQMFKYEEEKLKSS